MTFCFFVLVIFVYCLLVGTDARSSFTVPSAMSERLIAPRGVLQAREMQTDDSVFSDIFGDRQPLPVSTIASEHADLRILSDCLTKYRPLLLQTQDWHNDVVRKMKIKCTFVSSPRLQRSANFFCLMQANLLL